MRTPFHFIVAIFIFANLSACAPSLKSQYDDVARVVEERTGQPVSWTADSRLDISAREEIRRILGRPLTAGDATRIALINNRKLQSELAEVGVSRAELVQAGLFSNPQLFSRYRQNIRDSDLEEYELRLTQNLIDMLTMPLRRRVAKDELDRVKADFANKALDLAHRTRVAYYNLQARIETRGLQFQSGQATRKARHELAKLNAQIIADREQLNRLMGLSGPLAQNWTIEPMLPDLPAHDPPCEGLEQRALETRLDLASLRDANTRIEEAIRLQQITRWIPIFNVGVDYEKKSDIQRVIGPVLTIEVPIFDWGQGEIAKSRALQAQLRHEAAGLEIDIRSEVREACAALKAARAEVEFYDVITPEDEPKTEQDYIEALRDYWIARAKMSHVIGTRFAE